MACRNPGVRKKFTVFSFVRVALALGPLGRKSLQAQARGLGGEGERASPQPRTATPELTGSRSWRLCRARNPSPALLRGL